jgi:hypothetical protein
LFFLLRVVKESFLAIHHIYKWPLDFLSFCWCGIMVVNLLNAAQSLWLARFASLSPLSAFVMQMKQAS